MTRRMYYILTYDIADAKRLPKMLKLCRRYLHWVQNSTFEGELTTSQFKQLEMSVKKTINKQKDSVLIFVARTPEVIQKTVVGVEKNEITQFF